VSPWGRRSRALRRLAIFGREILDVCVKFYDVRGSRVWATWLVMVLRALRSGQRHQPQNNEKGQVKTSRRISALLPALSSWSYFSRIRALQARCSGGPWTAHAPEGQGSAGPACLLPRRVSPCPPSTILTSSRLCGRG
jgi:hypothetical protein